MGEHFNKNIMHTNFSMSPSAIAQRVRKQLTEAKRLGREKRANEPLPLSAIEKEKLARHNHNEKVAAFQRQCDKYFDSDGFLFPGLQPQRDVFRREVGGRVSVSTRTVAGRDMMMRLLLNGFYMEHPDGWTKIRSSPNPIYAPKGSVPSSALDPSLAVFRKKFPNMIVPPSQTEGAPPEPKGFVCMTCGKQFENINKLNGHIGASHSKRVVVKENKGEEK